MRPNKHETVQRLRAKLAGAKGIYFADFQGLNVAQANDLRNKCRAASVDFEVVKNTLALRAIAGTDLEKLAPHFDGPTAVAYSDGDAVALAKTLTDFAKDVPVVEFKGALVEGQPIEADAIKEIAKAPVSFAGEPEGDGKVDTIVWLDINGGIDEVVGAGTVLQDVDLIATSEHMWAITARLWLTNR